MFDYISSIWKFLEKGLDTDSRKKTNKKDKNSIDEKLKKLDYALKKKAFNEDERNDIVETAKYLYKNGYQSRGTLDFLGQGAYNTVFKIHGTNTVVKYCTHADDEDCSVDESPLVAFEEMVEKTTDTKLKKWAKKYLPNIKRINNKDIYEDSLGISDLSDSAADRVTKKSKTLDSLLKIAIRATKAVKVFHDNGFIHQDIKSDNIMKISNPKYLEAMEIADKNEYLKDDKGQEYCVVSKKIKKGNKEIIQLFKKYKNGEMGHKITKNTINVIDVGMMREIKGLIGQKQTSGTPLYIANDSSNSKARNGDDIKKWDVYALGITFYELLCGLNPGTAGKGLKETINLSPDWPSPLSSRNKDMEEFNKFYENNLKQIYSKDQFNRLYYFMKLINLMTVERDKRILLDEVLEKLEFIKTIK